MPVKNRDRNVDPKILMRFRYGMHSYPGFDDVESIPEKLTNVDLDSQSRLKLRKSYADADREIIESEGDRLGVFHYIGNHENEPNTIIRRFDSNASFAKAGRRIFVINPNQTEDDPYHKWIDNISGVQFDWTLPTPDETVEATFDPDYFNEELREDFLEGSVYETFSAFYVTPTVFTNFAEIIFTLIVDARVKLAVYDSRGFVVKTLIPEPDEANPTAQNSAFRNAGTYTYFWDGTNEAGERVAVSGNYFIGLNWLDDDDVFHTVNVHRAAVLEQPTRVNNSVEVTEAFVGDLPGATGPIDNGDLVPGIGFRQGSYAFCYTYASEDFGIETPPSRVIKIWISALPEIPVATGMGIINDDQPFIIFGGAEDPFVKKRAPVGFFLEVDISEAPKWADRIKFYARRAYFLNTEIEARELPFPFELIGEVVRDELPSESESNAEHFPQISTDTARFDWGNEDYVDPHSFLPTKEFHSDPPIEGISSVTIHAGRLWAYDKSRNAIRMSLIDGGGVSRYDILPFDNTAIPHALTLEGSWQSTLHSIVQTPDDGGLYAFYRDSIRLIKGKTILSGIYSPEIGPQTDLDASGGIDGIGSMSPRAIVGFNRSIIFLGSDRILYELGTDLGLQATIGKPIQSFLDEASDDDLRGAYSLRYLRNYLLYLDNTLFVYDTQYGYWRTYEYDIDFTDMVWSRGGVDDESILYGLGADGDLYHLGSDNDDESIAWGLTSNWQELPKNSVIQHIYCEHTGETSDLTIKIWVDERDPVTYTDFRPEQNNLFRMGVNTGRIRERFKIEISGTGDVPNFRTIYYD